MAVLSLDFTEINNFIEKINTKIEELSDENPSSEEVNNLKDAVSLIVNLVDKLIDLYEGLIKDNLIAMEAADEKIEELKVKVEGLQQENDEKDQQIEGVEADILKQYEYNMALIEINNQLAAICKNEIEKYEQTKAQNDELWRKSIVSSMEKAKLKQENDDLIAEVTGLQKEVEELKSQLEEAKKGKEPLKSLEVDPEDKKSAEKTNENNNDKGK